MPDLFRDVVVDAFALQAKLARLVRDAAKSVPGCGRRRQGLPCRRLPRGSVLLTPRVVQGRPGP